MITDPMFDAYTANMASLEGYSDWRITHRNLPRQRGYYRRLAENFLYSIWRGVFPWL